MTWNRVLALRALLLCLVFLNGDSPVLGQDETSFASTQVLPPDPPTPEQGEQQHLPEASSSGLDSQEERCPCMAAGDCPRAYGDNPLDFDQFGVVQPCLRDGFVRCCGVSVSVSQHTEESESVAMDDSIWEESELLSEETSTPAEIPKEQGPTQEQSTETQWQSTDPLPSATEEKTGSHDSVSRQERDESSAAERDEEIDDIVPAESRPEMQTVVIGGAHRSRLFKYNRRGMQASSTPAESTTPEESEATPMTPTSTEAYSITPSSVPGKRRLRNRMFERRKETEGETNAEGGGSIVYSQRVTDPAPTVDADQQPEKIDGNDNGSDEGTHSRPKYQMRRRRPVHKVKSQSEEEEKPVESSEGAAAPPPHVPALPDAENQPAEQTTYSPESPERRPMSRLVKPRVNGLNKPRRKFGNRPIYTPPNQSKPDEGNEVESSSSPSNGWTPTFDNEDQQLSKVSGGGEEQDETITSGINPKAGTTDESGSTEGKVLENSPTGKLMPFLPKIRPFNRKPSSSTDDTPTSEQPPKSEQLEEKSQVGQEAESGSSTDLIKSPAEQTTENEEKIQPTRVRDRGNVKIRKIPIRKVRPNPEGKTETENSSGSDSSYTTPARGRIPQMRRRRPSSHDSSSLQATTEQPQQTTQAAEVETEREQEVTPAPEVQKLDIRKRLRMRNQVTPKPEPETEVAPVSAAPEIEYSIENTQASSELARPTPRIVRRRKIRPVTKSPSSPSESPIKSADEEENQSPESGNYPAPAESEQSSLSPSGEDDSTTPATPEIATSLRNKFRKGPSRYTFIRYGNSSSSAAGPLSDDAAPLKDTNTPVETSTSSFLQRHKQRLTTHRGNVRTPLPSSTPAKYDNDSEKEYESSSQANLEEVNEVPTSESPVTVTSTYSRIRFNSKGGSLLPRPTYQRKKPAEPEAVAAVEEEKTTTVLPEESGPRTRFRVKSRLPPSRTTTMSPLQTDYEEKQTTEQQQQQLAPATVETVEQDNSYEASPEAAAALPEKKKKFGQRVKVRRRRPQQQHIRNRDEQPESNKEEEQQMLPHQQYQDPLRNVSIPEAQYSGHVAENQQEEIVAVEPSPGYNAGAYPDVSINEAEQERQQPSPHSSSDRGKTAPAEGDLYETSSVIGNSGKNKEDAYASTADEGGEDEYKHGQYTSSIRDANNGGDPYYDLVLSKDNRKTLGMHDTHETSYTDNLSLHQQQSYPETSTGAYGLEEGEQTKQGEMDDDDRDLYYHPVPSTGNTDSYSSSPGRVGGLQDPYFVDFDDVRDGRLNKQHQETATSGYDSLSDYDGNEPYSNFYGYGGEDEEESRVHAKVVSKQNEKQQQQPNEGKRQRFSAKLKELGSSASARPPQPSPVNPLDRPSESEMGAGSTESRPSSNGVSASDSEKRERNKRIRQKLRRPQSAYINNSEQSPSSSSSSSPPSTFQRGTSAPFSPSEQSPRPTYAGSEALVSSAKGSVPSTSEMPSSSSAPQKQVAPQTTLAPLFGKRNRTRVRVKLAPLKTTPAPQVENTGPGELVEETKSSSFTFPPFQKSRLTLIATTEAPRDDDDDDHDAPKSYSYTPPKFVFPSRKATTEATTPSPPRAQQIAEEKGTDDYSPAQVSPARIPQSSKYVAAAVSSPGKSDSRATRFKVSEMSSYYSPPSPSKEEVKTTSKPQQRIKSPQYIRKTPSTAAPLLHHQLPAAITTSAPHPVRHTTPEYPSREVEIIYRTTPAPVQSPPPAPVVMERERPTPTPFVEYNDVKEDEDANIRVTYHPHHHHAVTDDRQVSLVKPVEEPISPNSISYEPPSYNQASSKVPEKKKESRVVGESSYTPKGKYSARFKVPDRFQFEKGNSSSSVQQPPTPVRESMRHPVSYDYVEPPRQHSYEREEEPLEMYDEHLSVPVGPPPPQQQYQYHHQPEPERVIQHNYQQQQLPPPQYHHYEPSVKLEMPQEMLPVQPEEHFHHQPEVVPDIRINVHPMPQEVEAPLPQRQNYSPPHPPPPPPQPAEQPPRVYHAVKETFEITTARPAASNALRNSPYGPFPSTDHWSGIPSPNSPKLPEYFEQMNHQRRPTPQPRIRFESDQQELRQQQQPNFNVNVEHGRPSAPGRMPVAVQLPPQTQLPEFIRRPEPMRQQQQPHRAPLIKWPENDGFVREDEEEERLPVRPLPDFPQTLIKFGSQFEEENSNEESFPPRPINILNVQDTTPLFNEMNQSPPRPLVHIPLRLQQHLQQQQHQPITYANQPMQPEFFSPPQSPLPPDFRRPHPPIEVQSEPHLVSELRPEVEPNMNAIPSIVSQPQQPPPPPPPVKPVSYEIRNGELMIPYEPIHSTNEPPQNAPHQHHLPLPSPPLPVQNENVRFVDSPPPTHHQQQPHTIIQFQEAASPPPPPPSPPQPHFSNNAPSQHLLQELPVQQIMYQSHPQQHANNNFINSERPHEASTPSHLEIHNNIKVHVDGRPHDAPPPPSFHHQNQQQQQQHQPMRIPLERPVGNTFEFEPEQQSPSPPRHAPPEQMSNLNPGVTNFDHNQQQQVVSIREPQENKVPDGVSMLQGFADQLSPIRSNPGQYGPPPTSQQNRPQYVPFAMDHPDRPPHHFLRNESEQVELPSRPQFHHQSPPQGPAQHFGPTQSFPPFLNPPRQQHHPVSLPSYASHNVSFNTPPHGNIRTPFQQQRPHQQQMQAQHPPQHMMRLPHGMPQTRFGNNQLFMSRLSRNPNARTSRAANLTVEEEKLESSLSAGQAAAGRIDEESGLEEVASGNPSIPFLDVNAAESQADKNMNQKREVGESEIEMMIVIPPSELATLVSPLVTTSQRQQRELSFDPDYREPASDVSREEFVLKVEEDRVASSEEVVQEARIIQGENFVQNDQLPRLDGTPSESGEEKRADEDNADPSKSEMLIKLDSSEGIESGEETRVVFVKEFPDKRILSENKKMSLMKSKAGKMKSLLKGEKELAQVHHPSKEEVESSAKAEEQQESFVAPTVIQRGFTPILPYSEKDPGPIVVQLMPRVEKFLPPGRQLENGPPPPLLLQVNNPLLQDPHLYAKTPLATTAPGGLIPPFRSLTHNHLQLN